MHRVWPGVQVDDWCGVCHLLHAGTVSLVLRCIDCLFICEGCNGGSFVGVGGASVLALDHDIRGRYSITVPGLDLSTTDEI